MGKIHLISEPQHADGMRAVVCLQREGSYGMPCYYSLPSLYDLNPFMLQYPMVISSFVAYPYNWWFWKWKHGFVIMFVKNTCFMIHMLKQSWYGFVQKLISISFNIQILTSLSKPYPFGNWMFNQNLIHWKKMLKILWGPTGTTMARSRSTRAGMGRGTSASAMMGVCAGCQTDSSLGSVGFPGTPQPLRFIMVKNGKWSPSWLSFKLLRA